MDHSIYRRFSSNIEVIDYMSSPSLPIERDQLRQPAVVICPFS